MGAAVLYLCLFATAVAAIARPWVGVVAAYVFVVLCPQAIWWWDFGGMHPEWWALLPTLFGIIGLFYRGGLDLSRLKTRQNLYMFILWASFIISSFVGPYVHAGGHRVFQVAYVRTLAIDIFLLYFAATLLIDSEEKLKYMTLVMVLSTIYLIYWCNNQYFSHLQYGRIMGPTDVTGHGIYADQNAFAMLFVIGTPFLCYFGLYFKRKILRYGLWLIMPFGWNAIFLTASRGGLLGLAVTLLVIALRSPRKILGVGLILLFVVAYQMEAGSLMKSRADTIENYQHNSSAEGRIQAWEAAIKMIEAHPLTGVGLGSFVPAFPHYSKHRPRASHNTFFQIAAESGLTAGIAYLLMVFGILAGLWKNGSALRREGATYLGNFFYCLNEALLTAFIGFAVCATFLPLGLYEIFYFMCVLAAALTLRTESEAAEAKSGTGYALQSA